MLDFSRCAEGQQKKRSIDSRSKLLCLWVGGSRPPRSAYKVTYIGVCLLARTNQESVDLGLQAFRSREEVQ